jgi:hypothetical protein
MYIQIHLQVPEHEHENLHVEVHLHTCAFECEHAMNMNRKMN